MCHKRKEMARVCPSLVGADGQPPVDIGFCPFGSRWMQVPKSGRRNVLQKTTYLNTKSPTKVGHTQMAPFLCAIILLFILCASLTLFAVGVSTFSGCFSSCKDGASQPGASALGQGTLPVHQPPYKQGDTRLCA